MINHRVQAREYDLAARSERLHGWLRILGGLAGIGLLLGDDVHPSLVWRGEFALWMFFLAVGAYTVIVTQRRRRGPWIMPFRRLTLAVDAAVLLSQIPIHAYAGSHFDPSPALIVPLLGGIKGGYRLFAWCLAGLVAAEATWAAVVVSRFDTAASAAIEESMLNLVMGTAFGVLAAHLAHIARDGRHRADEEADRAEEAAFRAASARAEIEALHEVLRSALGRSEPEAAEQMVQTLSRALEGDVVLRISLGDGSPTSISARGLRPVLEAAAVQSTTPINVGDARIGELELRTVGAQADDAVMARLADQIAVALTAARQLDQQARLVTRHEELQRLKSEFISITSHELRTPLASVTAAADTLLERVDTLDETTRTLLLETVARNARRLDRLIEDLLTVGQLDSGVLSFQPADMRIDTLVREAKETCEQVGVTVIGGPPLIVHADPMRVYQILCNLAVNAATHGTPPIEMSWREDNELVQIDIVDHGGGLSEEDAERAFERFAQLDSPGGHRDGAGLGLPIARDLARAMGGDVSLPALDNVTVARLTLPRSAGRGEDAFEPFDMTTPTAAR